tara:strand:+ start:336 stop:728 length:393 start_codon:yes stop_codon:yes gene_type:complete
MRSRALRRPARPLPFEDFGDAQYSAFIVRYGRLESAVSLMRLIQWRVTFPTPAWLAIRMRYVLVIIIFLFTSVCLSVTIRSTLAVAFVGLCSVVTVTGKWLLVILLTHVAWWPMAAFLFDIEHVPVRAVR